MPDRTTDPRRVPGAFTMGSWRVEPQRNLLCDGAREAHVEPRAMDVLVCLAARAGEVVPRQHIVDTVWAAEFITDSTLTHAIAVLRRALGDDARSSGHIETIPKRGYRLVADVAWDEPVRPTVVPIAEARPDGPLAVVSGDRVQLSPSPAAAAVEHLLQCGPNEIPLTRPAVVFGRGGEADIQILASEVSRRHARLELGSGAALLTDLGSKNGTQVNDRTIAGPQPLETGDRLAVGSTSFVYLRLADEATRTREE